MKEYDLKRSYEKIGALYPVLRDAHGNVIDGFHRLKVDPKWPSIKLDHVMDPVQLTMSRLAANWQRRTLSVKEKREALEFIHTCTGWTAKEIAEKMGMSYRTIVRYIPEEAKNKKMQELASERRALPGMLRTVEKDELLDRLMKYYPMPLLDRVWQYVKEPAKRERVAYILVGILLEYAEEQKAEKDLLMKAVKIVR